MVKIADLKHTVQIQRVTQAPKVGGGYTPTWTTMYEVRARVLQSDGSETVRYGRVAATVPWKITIRYSPEYRIDSGMQVVYGAKKLNIIAVVNRDDANQWLDLSCEDVR